MNRLPAAGIALALFAASAALPSPPAAEQEAAFRRFALVVGTNDGGTRRVKLRYAHSDASAFAGVITELGGVRPGDLTVLEGPGRKDFLAALDDMKARLAAASGSARRLELLVYYSGHSDEGGLLLGEERIAYGEFRARIDAVPARIRLAVVDACASGSLTRLKGGSRLPAFAVDQSSSLSGYAFLTSSSGAESAQESDRIRASYFTHYLVSGLRGAADLNLDGKVTLSEAYEFAFHETLSQTEGSQAGAQHPSYDMRLTGSGDLVLTDLRGTSAGLVLDRQLEGRLFIRSSSGALVAELRKQPGRKVELGLEPGIYDMRLDRGDALYRSLVKVDSLAHHPVAFEDFEAAPRERNRERGGAEAAAPATAGGDQGWIPARAAFVPALGFPGRGVGPWSHNLSINLLVGQAQVIRGLQFSLLLNRSEEDLQGLQLALGFNRSGGRSRGVQAGLLGNFAGRTHDGVQIAIGANAAEKAEGLQAALINQADTGLGLQAGMLNLAGEGRGAQAGLANAALRHTGAQVGLVNASWSGTGAQLGILNVSGRHRGLQLGLINVAAHGEGAVIGAINLIGNGLHELETAMDERSMLRTALILGGTHNYTWYSFDMKARHPRHLWGGSAGMGLHLPRDLFFAEADLGGGWLGNENDWDNFSVTGRLRALMGYQPMRWFSLFGGLSYNVETWPSSSQSNLNPGSAGRPWGQDIRAERWTGFFLGVRI